VRRAEKSEKLTERKLRRWAKSVGLELHVSRTFYIEEPDLSGLGKLVVWNLTLDDAEKWLREEREKLARWKREHKPGS